MSALLDTEPTLAESEYFQSIVGLTKIGSSSGIPMLHSKEDHHAQHDTSSPRPSGQP